MTVVPFLVVAGFVVGGVVLIIRRDRIAARNRENLTGLGRAGLLISQRSTPATIAFVGFGSIVIGFAGLIFALSTFNG